MRCTAINNRGQGERYCDQLQKHLTRFADTIPLQAKKETKKKEGQAKQENCTASQE
jgi:hypothetical protein